MDFRTFINQLFQEISIEIVDIGHPQFPEGIKIYKNMGQSELIALLNKSANIKGEQRVRGLIYHDTVFWWLGRNIEHFTLCKALGINWSDTTPIFLNENEFGPYITTTKTDSETLRKLRKFNIRIKNIKGRLL